MSFRNKRTGKTLSQDLMRSLVQYKALVSKRLPEKAELILMNSVQSSFDQEQYKAKGSKWAPRKSTDKSAGSRKLLVKSGDLRRSFETFQRGADVGIGTDVEYAQVHNEGLKAGRSGFQMPQRQFMPKPGETNAQIERELEQFMDTEMDKIFR
jgi:phage gpG-like protein